MQGSKPCALPLGDTPISVRVFSNDVGRLSNGQLKKFMGWEFSGSVRLNYPFLDDDSGINVFPA